MQLGLVSSSTSGIVPFHPFPWATQNLQAVSYQASASSAGLSSWAELLSVRPTGARSRSEPLGAALGLCAGGFVAARRRRRTSALRALQVAGGQQATELEEVKQAPDNLREWRLKVRDQLKAADWAWPAPKNDRLLRAARGESVDRAPKWMMRQAGRYLPEYMGLLSHTDFFEVCKTPALAAEITLQPYRRYQNLDSLIIFSDILVIPVAMGMNCHMEPKTGPKFDFGLSSPADLARLNLTPDVDKELGYVFDAIFWTRQQVGNAVPVIGFCGAPWTLMGYMVEGGAARSFENAKKWVYLHPEASRQLMSSLRDIIIEYLVGQYDSGAPLLTVFDTNCGELPPRVYEEFCVPDLKFIAEEVKRRRPKALMSVFPKDGELSAFNDSAYDVVGVSWTASPSEARRQCPDKTLQGNLDPFLLYADPARIRERTQRMVREFGVEKYIANLGHGMMPSHPVEGPAAFIEGVDSVSLKDAPSPLAPPATNRVVQPLTLHLDEDTTISVPLSRNVATALQQALLRFVALFKEKMCAEKAKRYENLEFDATQGDLRLGVLCNPNAFATIFDVKVFINVTCSTQIKVASEVPLNTLQADLEAYLA